MVLENLDVLAHSSNDQASLDSEYYNRIGDIIYQLIIQYTNNYPIAVIATVNNIHNLNGRLIPSRGRHIFQKQVFLPRLNSTERELILKELSTDVGKNKLNLKDISLLTEGYNQGDLVQLMERAIFYAFRKGNEMIPIWYFMSK